MNGGQDTAKKYNRGFYGPYLNVCLEFGGQSSRKVRYY